MEIINKKAALLHQTHVLGYSVAFLLSLVVKRRKLDLSSDGISKKTTDNAQKVVGQCFSEC